MDKFEKVIYLLIMQFVHTNAEFSILTIEHYFAWLDLYCNTKNLLYKEFIIILYNIKEFIKRKLKYTIDIFLLEISKLLILHTNQ